MNEEMMKEWFDEDVSIDDATMVEFDKYVAEYLIVRTDADKLEDQLKEKNKILSKMQEKLIAYLDAQEKTQHVTSDGTITAVERSTWKAPEGGEAREQLVTYLKENGDYDAVMAFNANKFHGWFKAEKESNPNFDFPGVTQNSIRYIQFRRKKG